ncbi:hypothetical protein PVAND_007475 [Polypedilum vanderplanki]|uniref:Protein lethal(2)denticleless n=1 Tax=Polypedilum vanderplanki TaxID=319348 RepID=A0A9J6C7A8_POLVA|nr:hypothetical protein PVAND_007475 [Polypedilum vanderplanki]
MVKIINSVTRLTNRQYGKYYENSYDNVLCRLMVKPWDNWRGINPSGSADINPDPPIFAAKFAKSENYNHILAIANEDGRIALQNTFVKKDIIEDLSLEGDQCHFNAVFDIAWMPGHLKLVSASGDHTARLWDVSTSKLTNISEFNAHTRSVKVVTFPRNNCNMFATGGRDGAIIVWDTRINIENEVVQKNENIIHNAHAGTTGGPSTPSSGRRRGVRNMTPKLPTASCYTSVTGLVFQDDNTLISCGAGDGIIKVWDLRRYYSTLKRDPIAKYNLPYAGTSTLKGFTNLIVDEYGTRLYASCMDRNIYCYNINAYSKDPIMTYTGAYINTFYIKSCLSPDGEYLLSGSSDEKAYIWNVENPTPLLTLTGHSFEVTSVAWSHHQNNLDGGNMCIVTCSDDACHKIWRIGADEIPEDEKIFLRGKAELNPEYYPSYKNKSKFSIKQSQQQLRFDTPRSIRRVIEQSETTPTTTTISNSASSSLSVTSTGRKRSFYEACKDDSENATRSDSKRPSLETRGRRLFSPSEPSTSQNYENDMLLIEQPSSRSLATILEELESPNSRNFHNHSPSPVKRQLNIIKSPEPLKKLFASPLKQKDRDRSLLLLNSPTTNLPNFVVNPQDAPHLTNLTSPQRKVKKENVDWLTKMRKQKLLTLGNAIEKTAINQTNALHVENSTENDEKLKSIENKSDSHEIKKVQNKNGSTILKFFSVKHTQK